MHAVVRLYYLLRCCHIKKLPSFAKFTPDIRAVYFAIELKVLAAITIFWCLQ